LRETELTNSTLRPYDSRHGRHWDFSEFEILGRDFVAAFAPCFLAYSSVVARSTAATNYHAARLLLCFLTINRETLGQLIPILESDYTKATARAWEEALALWRDDLIGNDAISPVTKHGYIKSVNMLLRKMISRGVIPEITFLNSIPKARKASRATPSLAELHFHDIKEKSKKILEETLSGFGGTAVERQVKEDFLASLLSEAGDITGNPIEQAEALFQINRGRLKLLRSCAVKDFIKWRDSSLRGINLVRVCDLTFEEIAGIVDYRHKDLKKRSSALKTLFPEDEQDVSLARLLKYFVDHPKYRGRITWPQREIPPHWFFNLAPRFGGFKPLQDYLFPPVELTASVITLILCDTGANVSVALTLLRDCLEDSKERNYMVLKGNKMRAGGKIIFNELPIKDPLNEVSCVEAIQTYQMISGTLRGLATEKVANQLFLYFGLSGSVRNPPIYRWNNYFRAFCNRHPELKDLKIQSKMVRVSVLLQASMDKDAGLFAANARGDHASIATTYDYLARYPNHVIWAAMIRKFMNLFQAVSIIDIKGAAEKLGLSSEQVERLFNEACRTGLGVICLDPKAGVQPGSKKGTNCAELQNCPTCPNCIVVATAEYLKDLILWNEHLERHRQEWENSRPERWGKVWLPWLVFTQVVIEQASRGRTVKEFKRARALANEQTNNGEINLPPLW
jgi:hypothetical protein